MLKQLILFFHLISLSFATIFLSDGIEIETNLPGELVQDSTYIVDVVIKKGDLFGFAKFQQNFPEGFDVKPVETAEASFTYAEGKMKFIWMALPEIEEVKISYALTPLQGAPTEAMVDGKFSYIHDNERKSYDIPNQQLKVIVEDEEDTQLPAMASVSRVVTPLGKNNYKVELTIDKQGIYGFSKLEEYLPEGAEAEIVEGNKSVFSQVDEKAKFVWMSIPEDELLMISYNVKADEDILAALNSMEGNFSYLDENETKAVAVMGASMDEEAMMAQNQAKADEAEVADNAQTGEEIENPTEPDTETTDEMLAQQEAPAIDLPVKKAPVTTVPEPETGISYKVQIVAGRKLVDDKTIRTSYRFDEDFMTENHEGWVKYITGTFGLYKQARDKRESLIAAGHNFPGPFVTAYNNGERITVQEALMISNQQWVQ